jgi:type VI secretion system protein ImpA
MNITNSLDLAALTGPIPGDYPGGISLPYDIKDQLDQMRKEVDPDSFAADDPLRPSEFKKADWTGIIKIGSKTLTQTSKDLQVATRMVEALTRVDGFKGLGDGLELLVSLVENAWDRLVPVIDDPSDMDIRSAPFDWLSDPDRGARFPSTVSSIPLLDGAKDFPEMGLAQLKQNQSGGSASMDQVLAGTPLEKLQDRFTLVTRAKDCLNSLVEKLSEKLKDLAPSMGQLRTVLDQCSTLLGQIIARKSPPTGSAQNDGQGSASDSNTSTSGGTPALTRDRAYQMMSQAADILSAIEPHSPVPYLVRRAVQLGRLPFPELIQAFVREQNVLETMFRELGIQAQPPQNP